MFSKVTIVSSYVCDSEVGNYKLSQTIIGSILLLDTFLLSEKLPQEQPECYRQVFFFTAKYILAGCQLKYFSNQFFPVTGQPLRCDVFVDQITKVEIETTTKELFLDDSPEEFVMRAANDKGEILPEMVLL
jgi:hypothetical protein